MHQGNRCLTDEEIGAFLEGRLDTRSRDLLEMHLEGCGKCLNEIATLNRGLTSQDGLSFSEVPARLIKQAIALYPSKSLFFDAVISLTREAIRIVDLSALMKTAVIQPAFSLRNGKKAEPHMVAVQKSFDEIDAELIIEKVSDLRCNIKVIVVGITFAKSPPLRAGLFSGGRELASYHLENGEAIFEEVEHGRYTISINRQSRVYGEISLKIE